jgi:hypothetical protein
MGNDWADAAASGDEEIVQQADDLWEALRRESESKANGKGSAHSEDNGAGAQHSRFRLIPFDDLKPGIEQLYLVKRLIPRVGLTLIWGPPKCGKSFFAFALTLHVALGWEYRGHRIAQGAVVYCAFEGADGFKLRAEAFRRRHATPPNAPFFLIGAVMDLVLDHATLIRAIGEALGKTQPVAVVLDTLNRSLRGSESSDEDMAAYVRAADSIREAFGCAVIVVHHCGHDDKRPRGHSSLLGAVDAQIAVTRDANDNIIAHVERMKDGPEGATIVSRLEQIDVGLDEDGEPVTSCIVIPVEGKPVPDTRPKTLPKSAKIALRALEEALAEAGEPAPASNHIPPDTRVVSLDLWRQYAYRRGVSAADAKPRARQTAFKRASEHLLSMSEVAIWDEHVWIAR